MSFGGLVELICETLVNISWQATLLGIIVVTTQFVFSKCLRPEISSLLWLVLLIRLILVSGPESSMSISNYTGVQFPDAEGPGPALWEGPGDAPELLDLEYFIIRGLSTIWLVGVIIGFFKWLEIKIFWHKQFKKTQLVGNPEILNALADAEIELETEPQVTIVHSQIVQSPTLYGVYKPRLIIPTGMMDKLTPIQWKLIFRHEVAHIKRFDILTVNLIGIMHILHWFNPILRWLLTKILADIELAADSIALKNASKGEQKLYARTLLKFVECQSAKYTWNQPLRVCFWNSENHLISRFHNISGDQKKVQTSIAAGTALVIFLILTGLTDPVFPRPIQPMSFDSIRVISEWKNVPENHEDWRGQPSK